MHTVKLLPAVSESDLVRFISSIWRAGEDQNIEIDFSRVRFYVPAAVTALIARIDFAKANGGVVKLMGLAQCENFRYLQRIDFFNRLGIDLKEDFVRHAPGTAFVPLREIPLGPVTIKRDAMATELAACMAGNSTDDVFQLSQYALGEVIANVKQHAERAGFVCAQHFKKHEMSHIGVADCGIGLRRSFTQNASGKQLERLSQMNDLQILELAMAAYGSSKAHLPSGPYGEPANKGLGLTMTRFMAAQTLGHFFLSSGTAWWYRDGLAQERWGFYPDAVSACGTVLSVGFQRSQIGAYSNLRQLAWDSLGLTDETAPANLFT